MDESLTAGRCRGDHPDLGVYVVGALPPADRAAFEAHMAHCAACRDELANLAGLPGLLGRVSVEEIEDVAAPPRQHGAERLLAALAARRRRRRRTIVVALACACVAGLAGFVGVRTLGGGGAEGVRTVSAVNTALGVRGVATLTPSSAGTEVRMGLRGVVPGSRCHLTVVARDGRREPVGAWRASYEGDATVTTVTSVPLADIATLEVATDAGRVLDYRV
ncbi:MAG: zf-HC2 domain-containing protein [Thermoleophilia bacterium]